VLFELSIGHKDNLQILIPVIGNHVVKDLGHQLASLLSRIKTRGSKEKQGLGIHNQSQLFLKKQFVVLFGFILAFCAEFSKQSLVGNWIKRGIRRIEDSDSTSRFPFVGKLLV
jgi:hypothetical protein